jgi:hypothetical protein
MRLRPIRRFYTPFQVSGSTGLLRFGRYGWRKNLRALSLVRRRGTFAWTRVFPAGALAIGGFGRSRWRLRRARRCLAKSLRAVGRLDEAQMVLEEYNKRETQQ